MKLVEIIQIPKDIIIIHNVMVSSYHLYVVLDGSFAPSPDGSLQSVFPDLVVGTEGCTRVLQV